MKKFINLLMLFLASFNALAASNSNPGLYYGQVPTAAQWNSYFSSKLDYSPGAENTLPYWDGAGNLLAAPVTGGCSFAAGVFTCSPINLAGGATGSVPYQSATDVTAFLAGNTTTTPNFYTSTGTGAAAQAPTLTGSTGTGSVVLAGSPTLTANLTFSGSAARIMGDFSNATVSSRLMFQSNTSNGDSLLEVLPNGTSTTSAVSAYNNSDPTNAGIARLTATTGDARLLSSINGAGTYVPLTFYTSGAEKFRLDTSGNFLSTGGGGIGYGTGSGGTVTQLTSKSTAVTLNKTSGQITMNNEALAASTSVSFILTNSTIGPNDGIVATLYASSVANQESYIVQASARGTNGTCFITLRNISAGSLSEAVVINFQVIKGSIN